MKKVIYCAALCLVATACQKNFVGPSSSNVQSLLGPGASATPLALPGNVYVTGDVSWKNGIVSTTPGGASVYVSASNDVYVTGSTYNASNISVARLWKNGILTNLSDGRSGARANAVFVSGVDVYVAGTTTDGMGTAKIWKNGVASSLPNGSEATAVFVSGTDVYAVGYQNTPNSSFSSNTTARLWKNGQEVALSSISIGRNVARAVFVSGSNVYVAGYFDLTPVLWKNGVITKLNLPSGAAYPQSVFVSGNDVYVAGFAYNANNYASVLWKNNVLTTLSPVSSRAFSVFVSGTDVYVVGDKSTLDAITDDGNVYTYRSMIWKNGIAATLPGGTTAKSVFVR